MRRLFIGLVVAATTVLMPAWALADNQEVAEQIADNLRDAQLHGYKIGVTFQNGTAWLRGKVASEEQLARALMVVSKTEGVDRVVNCLDVKQKPVEKLFTTRLKTPQSTLEPEQVSGPSSSAEQRSSGKILRPATRLQQLVDSRMASTKNRRPANGSHWLAKNYMSRQVSYTAAEDTSPQEEKEQLAPQQPVQQQMVQPQPVRRQRIQQQMARPQMIQPQNAGRPVPVAYLRGCESEMMPAAGGGPVPAYSAPAAGVAPVRYDQPCMPNYSWPSYAAYPNYAALTYPKQYSPTAWPYIGPFYPYPQVPLGWRKVTLEWDDGWWMLDFKDSCCH